jgi:acetyltransferase-like isoleucine patch superfamily enzyme
MEEGSQISPHAIIGGGGDVHLGKFTVVGFGAMLLPATDSPAGKYMCEAKAEEERKIIRGCITLEKGAYIGSGAIVCVSAKHPDIRIGKNTVIGALSYVDKSIPANTIMHPVIKYHKMSRKING